MMQTTRRRAGFTLMEMIIATAIIAILAAIVFINVVAYQRSLKRTELDGIAKEIFVAAQNHLTTANSLGLLDDSTDSTFNWGTKITTGKDKDKDIYFCVYPGTSFSKTALGLMLPFGSLDETVRAGGSYVISYQHATGLVQNVFYAEPTGRFPYTFQGLSEDAFNDLVETYADTDKENKAAAREKAKENSVIGWYGAELNDLKKGDALEPPTVTITNAERLTVKVDNQKNNGKKGQLRLIVTGRQSGAKRSFDLLYYKDEANPDEANPSARPQGVTYLPDGIDKDKFEIVLDDVTSSDKHFVQVFGEIEDQGRVENNDKSFIPGENLRIEAVAYNNHQLTNVATSESKITNSLFSSMSVGAGGKETARVANFRHLLNLDPTVSNLSYSYENMKKQSRTLDAVEQISNMDWNKFLKAIDDKENSSVIITTSNGTESVAPANTYLPVTPKSSAESTASVAPLAYNGRGHTISNVVVEMSDNAGLFGTFGAPDADSKVENLVLDNFKVDSNAPQTNAGAGALVGSATNTSIEGVVAYNSKDDDSSLGITGSNSAGGLVGSMTGGSIKNSAAAVYVSATAGSAGGLVGVVGGTNPSITHSYSGGHTNGKGQYDTTKANVSATGGNAGGLIGTQNGGTISYCYSTCSASSTKSGTDDVYAGGLIGQGTNVVKIENCYVTGLVLGDAAKKGIFAGTLTGTTMENVTNNHYLSIVNESQKSGDDNVGVIADGTQFSGITAADADTQSYSNFAPGSATAVAYDSSLGNKYPYKTVVKLIYNENEVHYGDWPMVETLVTNTKN